MPCYENKGQNCWILNIKVVPHSKKMGVLEVSRETLKIGIPVPPEDGKANKALVDFLSKEIKVCKSNFVILSGQKSRLKKVQVEVNQEKMDTFQRKFFLSE